MNWEELRANWVNGNRNDVYNALITSDLAVVDVLKIVREAISEAYKLNFQSGDLTDLLEILNYIRLRSA